MTPAVRAADCCAQLRRLEHQNSGELPIELHDQIETLQSTFDAVEIEMQESLSYSAESSDTYICPGWYRPIMNYRGSPLSVHFYSSVNDVAIWNTYRMARMKLHSTVFDQQLHEPITTSALKRTGMSRHETLQALIMKISTLIEDVCASVFYSFSHREDGLQPISSFEDIAGAKAYALITPLTIARDCLARAELTDASPARLDWINRVLKVMEERLGVSEAWCWEDGDEMAAKLEIERQLSFGRSTNYSSTRVTGSN